jgi:hypothetical protein
MRKGFKLIAVVIHTVALVIFITVGIPIRPSTFMYQLVNRLGLGVRTIDTSICFNASLPFGRFFGYNTVIKVVIGSLITATDRAGHLVSVFVYTYPVAPFVTAKVLGIAVFSLTMANVRIYAIVSPIAKVVIKSGNIFCLRSVTIGASEGLYARFGAGGGFGFYAVVPIVCLGLFLSAFTVLAGTGMGSAVAVVLPITEVTSVGIYGWNIVTVEANGILGIIGRSCIRNIIPTVGTLETPILAADEIVLTVILSKSEGKHCAAHGIEGSLIQKKITFGNIVIYIAVCHLLSVGFGAEFILVSVSIVSYYSSVEINNPFTGIPHALFSGIARNAHITVVVVAITLEWIHTVIGKLEHNGCQTKPRHISKLLGIYVKHKFRRTSVI